MQNIESSPRFTSLTPPKPYIAKLPRRLQRQLDRILSPGERSVYVARAPSGFVLDWFLIPSCCIWLCFTPALLRDWGVRIGFLGPDDYPGFRLGPDSLTGIALIPHFLIAVAAAVYLLDRFMSWGHTGYVITNQRAFQIAGGLYRPLHEIKPSDILKLEHEDDQGRGGTLRFGTSRHKDDDGQESIGFVSWSRLPELATALRAIEAMEDAAPASRTSGLSASIPTPAAKGCAPGLAGLRRGLRRELTAALQPGETVNYATRATWIWRDNLFISIWCLGWFSGLPFMVLIIRQELRRGDYSVLFVGLHVLVAFFCGVHLVNKLLSTWSTVYAITNRRIITLQRGYRQHVVAIDGADIRHVVQRQGLADGSGKLTVKHVRSLRPPKSPQELGDLSEIQRERHRSLADRHSELSWNRLPDLAHAHAAVVAIAPNLASPASQDLQ
jgi:hypothetical protein